MLHWVKKSGGVYIEKRRKRVKKFLLNAVVLILAILAVAGIQVGGQALAAGGDKIFSHDIAIHVEPIETQVIETSNLWAYPNQQVRLVYRITNHSLQTHYNLIASLNFRPNFPNDVGIRSDWKLAGRDYAPGNVFQVPSGTSVDLVITIYAPDYAGEIPLNVDITRISSEPGKG